MVKGDITSKIEVPSEVEVKVEGKIVSVKGPKGELKREFKHKNIKIVNEEGLAVVAKQGTKREKKNVFTITSHIKNMIEGVTEGFNYKLKICSSHFPMNVSIKDGECVIKNFLGEKIPRKAKILEGVNAKVEGDLVILDGINKEYVGQSAANIEQSTRITNRCRRVFQDGVFIIEKNGKNMI